MSWFLTRGGFLFNWLTDIVAGDDLDSELQSHIVPVGLDSLFSVDLKSSILFPDFWVPFPPFSIPAPTPSLPGALDLITLLYRPELPSALFRRRGSMLRQHLTAQNCPISSKPTPSMPLSPSRWRRPTATSARGKKRPTVRLRFEFSFRPQ